MSNTTITKTFICLLMLLTAGCTATSGSIRNGVYYSETGSFEIPIPYPSANLHISDFYEPVGELVRFDVEYAFHHKLERFRISQHAISNFDSSQPIEFQLREIESNLFGYLDVAGATTEAVFSSDIKSLRDQLVLITVRKISVKDTDQIRGVLICIGENYINTFHFTHPTFREKDVDRVIAELERFFGSAKIYQT